MTLSAAPYFAEIADGPETGAAFWAQTSDGVRIRVGAWRAEQERGTLLLMPGRTEYIEKYARLARDITARGYAMVAVDWRGQGLADRLLDDRRVGHVQSFADFQHDVAAMVEVAETLNLPKPWHVLGHSMGGAIALRAVHEGLDVKSATFTGPMWGILIAPGMRQLAWGLIYTSGWTGQDHRLPPTTRYENYVAASGFEGNMLTNDRDMWDYMKTQITTHSELSLGGPSLRWLGEALRECRHLMSLPAPDLPAICFVGEQESIVDRDKMRARMVSWPDGRFEQVPDAQHEVLMEGLPIRTLVLEQMMDLFARGEARSDLARTG
jgi:lysophospholipase